MAGAVLAYGAYEWFLSCMYLNMSVKESFPHKSFPTPRPCTGVAICMNLLGVSSHVSLAEECYPATEVGRVQSFVHCHHMPLQVVSPIRLVIAFRVSTLEWLVLPVPGVTVRGGEVRHLGLLVLLLGGCEHMV